MQRYTYVYYFIDYNLRNEKNGDSYFCKFIKENDNQNPKLIKYLSKYISHMSFVLHMSLILKKTPQNIISSR